MLDTHARCFIGVITFSLPILSSIGWNEEGTLETGNWIASVLENGSA